MEARKLLVLARGSDDDDGTNSNSKGLVEYLRRDRNGKPVDARYALVGRDQATYDTRRKWLWSAVIAALGRSLG